MAPCRGPAASAAAAAAPSLMLALLLLAALSAPALAQDVHIGTNLVDSDHNMHLAKAACVQLDTNIWCRLIEMYKSDPTIARLFDGQFDGTLFAPTDRGIHNVSPLFPKVMGTTLGRMLDGQDPAITTMWLRAHMITNEPAIVYSSWFRKTWTNNLGQQLSVVEGLGRDVPPGSRRQYFIQGPNNIVRAGFQARWDIIGGEGLMQVVEDPLLA